MKVKDEKQSLLCFPENGKILGLHSTDLAVTVKKALKC